MTALVLATALTLQDGFPPTLLHWPQELVEAVASVGYEAGPLSLWQDEDAWLHAQGCVIWTAVNRLRSDSFPDDETVADEYYAAWNADGEFIPPTDQQLELALQVLGMDAADDPTKGALFAMSAMDVRWLQWPDGDGVLRAADGVHAIHFYGRWLGLPDCWGHCGEEL